MDHNITSFYLIISVFLLFSFPLGSCKAPMCTAFSIPQQSANVVEENKQISRQMNRNAKLWQLNIGPSIPNEDHYTTNSSLAILDLTSQVVKSVCPDEFIPHRDLIDRALSAFAYLHDNTGNVRYFGDPVNPSVFTRIASALLACQQTVFPKNYYFSSGESNGCPSTSSVIRQVCRVYNDHDTDVSRCQKLKLRHERREGSECFQNTNLIIDIVWSIVEIVHVACFKEFQTRDDISAFYMWEQALEGLFTRKIRKYWYQAPLSLEMYQTILHPDIRQQIFNLEMCIEGITQLIPNKIPRLQRPAYPILVYDGKRRRKRSIIRNFDKLNNLA